MSGSQQHTHAGAGGPGAADEQGGPGDDLAVAVVGAAVRVPGSETVQRFWHNLCSGTDQITRGEGAPSGDGTFVRAYGSLPHPAHFDPARFGISEAEAVVIDPQQRLLLEVADEALATANVDRRANPAVGVYAGVGRNDYEQWLRSALAGRPGVDDMALEIGNGGDYAATRIAYRLGLRGAAVNVQSACSTGLVAVHLAAQDLLGFGCDTAVAAASTVRVPGPGGYAAPLGGIGSPDGVCRPFDLNANGSVPGDGACAVVLKRLEDARRDGDEVWAVLRGSAMNNDGAAKSGFAGVNPSAQRDVMRAALDAAGLDPEDIGYVEAHGSGTRLGDASEWSALSQVFDGVTHPVHIGAVKANLGHLREAAGLAGLLKTVLALRHQQLPPTAHFGRLPGDLASPGSQLSPLAESVPWPVREERTRRAGVSAFGLGGTNCHVVLEEAPLPAPAPGGAADEGGQQLLLVSSHRAETLERDTAALREHTARLPSERADIAWTTQTARHRYARRGYAVLGPQHGAPEREADPKAGDEGSAGGTRQTGQARQPLRQPAQLPAEQPEFAFVLPGIGSHYPGMGAELARTNPLFAANLRTAVAIADELTQGSVGRGFADDGPRQPAAEGGASIDVRAMLRRRGKDAREAAQEGAERPPLRHLHLSLFCLEHAMARTLLDLGLRPAALLGHSLGEWVSATLSGIIGLEDAMAAVARRADLVTMAGDGTMLAVLAPAAQVEQFQTEGAWLAADNAPQHCVFSGRPEPMEELHARLREAGFTVLPFGAFHPFHTPQLKPAADTLGADLRGVTLRPGTIPIASSVLGEWLDGAVPPDGYWHAHMTSPVRFRDAAALVLNRHRLLIEVGPGTARPWLTQADPDAVCVRTVRQAYEHTSDQGAFLEALGELWTHGVEPDWPRLHQEPRRRVTLPPGTLLRRRYLPDLPPPAAPDVSAPAQTVTGAQATALTGDPATAPEAAVPDEDEAGGDPLAAHLRSQWRTLLGLREVHADDHFFHLGGDSLMGVHLISGLAKLTGRNVPSAVVFASATLGGMTGNVRAWLEEPGDDTAAPSSTASQYPAIKGAQAP